MNRGWIIGAIVVGVLAVAGGATYYFTDKYGSPDDRIAALLPPGLTAPASPAVEGPPPPPPPTAPVNGAAPAGSEAGLEMVFNTFDHRTQSLVWVLPPGIQAEGPFVAHVTVTSRGQVKHQSDLPLVAAKSTAGVSTANFPPGSNVLRLSLDDTWPAERDELKKVVDQLKTSAPGANELDIASDFKTKIDPAYKRQYCMQSDKIAIDLYVEDAAARLQKIDISEALPILQRTIVTGGCIG